MQKLKKSNCIWTLSEDPSSFGVVNFDENGSILEFEEKPKSP